CCDGDFSGHSRVQWPSRGNRGIGGVSLAVKAKFRLIARSNTAPSTQTPISWHPFEVAVSTRMGGRVIVIFATTLYEDPRRARIRVGQPPVPHHVLSEVHTRFLHAISVQIDESILRRPGVIKGRLVVALEKFRESGMVRGRSWWLGERQYRIQTKCPDEHREQTKFHITRSAHVGFSRVTRTLPCGTISPVSR